MKVAQLLESRRNNWQELERLCFQMERRKWHRVGPATLSRFGALYRAVCADLAMADAYQLPQNTVQYLHQLVARAHNQLHRSRAFNVGDWTRQIFQVVPQRLFHDNCLRLAAVIFWGLFILGIFLGAYSEGFAEKLVGEDNLVFMEEMHSESIGRTSGAGSAMGTGFYIWHNTTIGLRCFAYGLIFGVGGLIELVFNALFLGTVFGHMTTTDVSDNFFNFVTAHAPFELTAIVLSAAAGMRLGFSMIYTRGLTRVASLRRAAREIMPVVGVMMVLFAGAALIEGFISPTEAPYPVKAGVAAFSAGLLMFYFIGLGFSPEPPEEDHAA